MPPRTVSEDFEQYSADRVTQPSVGGVIKYPTVEYTKSVASTSMRAGGVGMQRGGRTKKNAGRGMQRADLAMSRSGVSAVAGATARDNKKVSTAPKRPAALPRNNWKLKKLAPMEELPSVKKRIAATRVNVSVLSVAAPIWFTLQFPLAILTLITFGGAGSAAEILPDWLVEWATNGVLYVLQVSVFFIGLGTLIVMGIIYSLARVNCFFGQGAHIKGPVFCLAVVGYLLPFTNIFPWFILWAWAVWRYPN